MFFVVCRSRIYKYIRVCVCLCRCERERSVNVCITLFGDVVVMLKNERIEGVTFQYMV